MGALSKLRIYVLYLFVFGICCGCTQTGGTLTGAAIGTGAGAGVGYAVGGKGGAILGGAIGGLAGGAFGNTVASRSSCVDDGACRTYARRGDGRYDHRMSEADEELRLERRRLEIERQRLELERERLELERQMRAK